MIWTDDEYKLRDSVLSAKLSKDNDDEYLFVF